MLHEHDGARGLGRHAVEWDIRPHTTASNKIQLTLSLASNCICTNQTLGGFPKATLCSGLRLGAGALDGYGFSWQLEMISVSKSRVESLVAQIAPLSLWICVFC